MPIARSTFIAILTLLLCSLGSIHCLAQTENTLSFNHSAIELPTESELNTTFSDELPSARVPLGTLRLSETNQYLFWAEAKNGLLHLLERNSKGGFDTLKSIKMSIGKEGYGKSTEGDKRTPIGVYRITSFLNKNQLTDFYGDGAYPLDYPNANDKLHARTGHGIWLHGLPQGVDSRPARDSDGCVVIDNPTLNTLAPYIITGDTYMVIDEELQWQNADQASAESEIIEEHFHRWLNAWKSIDNDIYLNYYAQDFNNLEKDKASWESYKRRIHKHKKFIDVKISNLSVFDYPGEENLVSVRYYQAYKSSNYRWNGWKEQLWKNINGDWKIIYEGDA